MAIKKNKGKSEKVVPSQEAEVKIEEVPAEEVKAEEPEVVVEAEVPAEEVKAEEPEFVIVKNMTNYTQMDSQGKRYAPNREAKCDPKDSWAKAMIDQGLFVVIK